MTELGTLIEGTNESTLKDWNGEMEEGEECSDKVEEKLIKETCHGKRR